MALIRVLTGVTGNRGPVSGSDFLRAEPGLHQGFLGSCFRAWSHLRPSRERPAADEEQPAWPGQGPSRNYWLFSGGPGISLGHLIYWHCVAGWTVCNFIKSNGFNLFLGFLSWCRCSLWQTVITRWWRMLSEQLHMGFAAFRICYGFWAPF